MIVHGTFFVSKYRLLEIPATDAFVLKVEEAFWGWYWISPPTPGTFIVWLAVRSVLDSTVKASLTAVLDMVLVLTPCSICCGEGCVHLWGGLALKV